MELIFLFIILPTIIALTAAYFISLFTRNKLRKADNKNAKIISVVTFLVSFLVIIIAIFALIAYNIEIGR